MGLTGISTANWCPGALFLLCTDGLSCADDFVLGRGSACCAVVTWSSEHYEYAELNDMIGLH